jgi:hypothetical protein
MEIREYECHNCHNVFFVDCDADNYPDVCPYCQISVDHEFDHRGSYLIGNEIPFMTDFMSHIS